VSDLHIVPQVKHLQGDRQDFDGLKEKLKGTNFNIVYDINGNPSRLCCFLWCGVAARSVLSISWIHDIQLLFTE
jgi:hypothetical protein